MSQHAEAQRIAQLEGDRANRTRSLLKAEEEVVELRSQLQLQKEVESMLRERIADLEREVSQWEQEHA